MAWKTPVFRLFVSSTFEDLKAERQALHERVFPELAQKCRDRGARFQPLDLRWGVSADAGRDHRTMQICLDEITRCQRLTPRPNFLALLGDRYGWRPVPAAIPAVEFESIVDSLAHQPATRRLLRRYYSRDDNAVPAAYVLSVLPEAGDREWAELESQLHDALRAGAADLHLAPQRRLQYEASATHLEIDRGILSAPDPAGSVLCVMRSIQGLPGDSSAAPFLDVTLAGSPDRDAGLRIRELKASVRSRLQGSVLEYGVDWAGHGPATDHLDVMVEEVRARLWSLIRERLDAVAQRDDAQDETMAHWSFARARLAEAPDLETSEAVADAIAHLTGDIRVPLVLTGAGGVGKTTFAAAVADRLRSHAGVEVFARFVGTSADSALVPTLLSGLASEAARRYGLPGDIPVRYDGLVSDLWARLDAPPDGRKTVLVIDGIDRLGGVGASAEPDWLPTHLPEHVGLLVSAAPGPVLGYLLALPQREVMQLEPMTIDSGAVALDHWLAARGRTLQPEQRDYLLTRFAASGLPLYLRLATEEAIRWRSNTPKDQIRLEMDVEGTVRALIGRLARDADHGPVLVSHALAYLTCGRSGGLAEDELLDALAIDEQVLTDVRRLSPLSPVVDVLPMVVWARLRADLSPYLGERRSDGAELLVFFHRLFSTVVADLCVGSERRQRHNGLAQIFSLDPVFSDTPNRRALSELPWQLAGAGRGRELAAILTDYSFLLAKLQGFGPQPLLDDFTLASSAGDVNLGLDPDPDPDPTRGARQLLAEVIEQTTVLLTERPMELAAQLYGRLMDVEDAVGILEQIGHRASHPWLRPLRASLSRPGGALVRTIETRGGGVEAVTFSPDGRHVLAACRDTTIEVWDVRQGRLARTLHGHGVFARCVAVTPDGHRAVSGGRVRPGEEPEEMRLWDLDQGRLIRAFAGPDHDFGEIAVLPDGDRAVATSYDGTVRIWDLRTGETLTTLRGHAWYVQALSVSADGRIAASGADDGTIRIWDLDRGEQLRVLETDHVLRAASPEAVPPGALVGVTQIDGVAMTPDGRLLVSTSPQEGMCFWDVESGARVERFQTFAREPRITKDGQSLVIFNNGRRAIEVWDLPTRTEVGSTEPIAYWPSTLAVSDDGRTIIAGGSSTITVWRLDRITGGVTPVSEIIAAAIVEGEPPIAVVSTNNCIEAWSLQTGEALWRNADEGAQDLVSIPGRRAVAAGRLDGGVAIVDAESGTCSGLAEGLPHLKEIGPAKRPSGPVLEIGGMIVEARADHYHAYQGTASGVRAIDDFLFITEDPTTETEEGDAAIAAEPIQAVAASMDGRWLATSSRRGITIWDIESRQAASMIHATAHNAKALAFAPDGSVLVSLADTAAYAGEHNLKRWKVPSGDEITDRPSWRTWFRTPRRERDTRSSTSSPYQTRPLAITDNGSLAVSALFGDGLRSWQLHGPAKPRTLSEGSQQETVAALSGCRALAPDGYRSPQLLIWDLESGHAIGSLVGHTDGVTTLAVADGAQRALSAGSDLTVRLWDLHTQASLATFTIEDFPNVCALSADGLSAIVGDRRSLHLLRFEPGKRT